MIKLQNVSVRQGEFELTNINLRIESGTYAVLMGPTGCGKTTILETICGLRKIRSGSIRINGDRIDHRSPAQRGIGYVPQDYALFPTMRIDRQIEYGLTVRGVSSATRTARVKQIAELTETTHLLKRRPVGLSGGERQRVALARAIAFRPKLLCLDEPLGALDIDTKKRLTHLLQTIYQQEGVTLLHVTHSLHDAKQLGNSIFTMAGGTIKSENLSPVAP